MYELKPNYTPSAEFSHPHLHTYGIIFLLLIPILISYLALINTRVSAADVIDDVAITVPASCSIETANSGTGETYILDLNPGQYKNDIGPTTISVSCNGYMGFSIYAIGFSDDEYGNTDMISSDPDEVIATGTTTSGAVSSWAMKMVAVTGSGTGSFTPTIVSPFNNFTNVPGDYAKVATVTSTSTNGYHASVEAWYAIYASPIQYPDSYSGSVKYTIVNPHDADAPNYPRDTPANKIGYFPNASSVSDNMGDQNIAASVTLWAPNFKRPGYGFAGWSDKYDWVLNENDTNGNGTGVNAGYHIYGPNEIITLNTADYTNAGLSLYAVWVPSDGTIQNWNGCSALQEKQVTALTDLRDNQTYAVAKLPDGNCWMIENMRLNVSGSNNGSLAQGFDTGFVGLPNPEYTGFGIDTANNLYSTGTKNTMPRFRDDNTLATTTATTMVAVSQAAYGYGNYYSWPSAIASITAPDTTATITGTSICPSGWQLPYGGNKTTLYGGKTKGGFAYLDVEMGGTGSNQQNTAATLKWRKYPVNFVTAGGIASSASVSSRGTNGWYWSSTVASVGTNTISGNNLVITGSRLDPGTAGSGSFAGRSIRCLTGV